ncbi:hypothetical protein LR48_Vigan10g167900 [Vigna angularis]|uniref:Uncharacterized protein n=1 Tax=Phaseolus angularis TaxID=3914 RepID=A0A0L9VLL0_PHAAN|nr:hypothetical protein LR48_Vigan10g167900 [Vigna angularis]
MEVDASFTKCKQRDGSTNEGIIDDTNDATTMEVAAMNAGGDDPRQRSDKGRSVNYCHDYANKRGRSVCTGLNASVRCSTEIVWSTTASVLQISEAVRSTQKGLYASVTKTIEASLSLGIGSSITEAYKVVKIAILPPCFDTLQGVDPLPLLYSTSPWIRIAEGSEISFLLLRLDSFLNERPNFGAAPGVLGKPNRVFSFALPRGGFVPLLGKEAWETVWLPEDLTPKMRAPWESDVNFPSSSSSPAAAIDAVAEADKETKAFVAKMNENWNEQRRGSKEKEKREENGALWRI